jgi:hypothetical protein
MKSFPTVLVLGSTVAALTMLAKSDLLQLLMAALRFAATVLPAFVWIKITFVV